MLVAPSLSTYLLAVTILVVPRRVSIIKALVTHHHRTKWASRREVAGIIGVVLWRAVWTSAGNRRLSGMLYSVVCRSLVLRGHDSIWLRIFGLERTLP